MSFTAAAIASAAAGALGYYHRVQAEDRARCEAALARRMDRLQVYGPRLRSPHATPRAGKCECCGARDWVTHAGRSVCSYCRSGQDAKVAGGGGADRYSAHFGRAAFYGSYALGGREALFRLTME